MREIDKLIERYNKWKEQNHCDSCTDIDCDSCITDKCDGFLKFLLDSGVVVFPCKVGDTIYYVVDDEITELNVKSIEIDRFLAIHIYAECVAECDIDDPCIMPLNICKGTFSQYDFNSYVFFTREEAEKALKEADE